MPCGFCGERKYKHCPATWQQWQCNTCGNWNNKPTPGQPKAWQLAARFTNRIARRLAFERFGPIRRGATGWTEIARRRDLYFRQVRDALRAEDLPINL